MFGAILKVANSSFQKGTAFSYVATCIHNFRHVYASTKCHTFPERVICYL